MIASSTALCAMTACMAIADSSDDLDPVVDPFLSLAPRLEG